MEDTNLAKKSKAELVAMVEDLTEQISGNKTVVVGVQAKNDELKKTVAALQKKLDSSKTTVVTDSTKALNAEIAAARKSNAALREIIELSCKDHCPHHQQQEACKNCVIRQKLAEIVGAEKE